MSDPTLDETATAGRGQHNTGHVSVVVAGHTQEVSPLDAAVVVLIAAATGVATAAVQGVIGNAAYDLLKIPYLRLRGSHPDPDGASLQPDELWIVAKYAVQARCGELNWPVPRLESLKQDSLDNADGQFRLRLSSPEVKGEVVIPAGRLNDARLEVTLRSSRPG